jgi:hypothetical protein
VKSLAVIGFIALVAAVALFCAKQRTVARGEALAASLLETNKMLKGMICDDNVPIGMDGATFKCKVEWKNGNIEDYKFKMNREGSITAIDHGPTNPSEPKIKKTSDPWGD